MAYIDRDDALALIIEQRGPQIIGMATETSVAMQTFRRINMGTSIYKMALLDAFPDAQWLVPSSGGDPDVVKKPTTTMAWATQDLVAEEAACIVVIPENVIDDASVDLWGEIQRRCAEAVARLIDQTVFFGTAPVGSVPTSFPVGGIVGGATAAGNVATPAADDTVALSFSQAMALVEADGYDPTDAYADRALRAGLRDLTDNTGRPLYASNLQDGVRTDSIYGVGLHYTSLGSWDKTKAQAVVGDPTMAVIGLRQDLTAKQLTEATVNGYNLAEQDMVALRVKIRLGFVVLSPKAPGQGATPYPFAVVAPAPVGP